MRDEQWPAQTERFQALASWHATTEEQHNGDIRVMFMLDAGAAYTLARFGPGTLIDVRLNRYSRACLHQSLAFHGPLEWDGLPPVAGLPGDALCDECAFPDTCRADSSCARAALQVLDFEAAPSAIIEPATVEQLAGATAPAPLTARDLKGAYSPNAAFLFTASERPKINPDADCRRRFVPFTEAFNDRPHFSDPKPQGFTRAQVRAAIAEIEKAQKDIAPAFTPDMEGFAGSAAEGEEWHRTVRTAANVVEALPEIVAQAFGLTIRAGCADCGETIFTDEPKVTDAAGKDICAHHVLDPPPAHRPRRNIVRRILSALKEQPDDPTRQL